MLLDWAEAIINRLPLRCTFVAMVDGNAHLGSEEAMNINGHSLIGGWGAQAESAAGKVLRSFACRTNMAFLNTLQSQGSGRTWCGGRRVSNRVDYLWMKINDFCKSVQVKVDYNLAVQIQLSSSATWMDHAPLQTIIAYRANA